MLIKTATPIPQLIQLRLSARLGYHIQGDIIDHGVIRYRLPSQEILIYAMQAISDILHKNYLSDDESYAFTFRFNNEDNCYHLFVEETLDSE